MKEVGRLAMRVEGDDWVAYYALPDTMEGALRLGAVKMAIVSGGPRQIERKWVFMGLMREAVADFLEARSGVRPDFNEPVAAPER